MLKFIVGFCITLFLFGCTQSYDEVCAKGAAEIVSAQLNGYNRGFMISKNRDNTRKVADIIKQAYDDNFWIIKERKTGVKLQDGRTVYMYTYRRPNNEEIRARFLNNMYSLNVDESTKISIVNTIINSHIRDYNKTEYYRYLYEYLQ